jgi:hypothetical protein
MSTASYRCHRKLRPNTKGNIISDELTRTLGTYAVGGGILGAEDAAAGLYSSPPTGVDGHGPSDATPPVLHRGAMPEITAGSTRHGGSLHHVGRGLLPDKKHAFLSYQWDVQADVSEIKAQLVSKGIKCTLFA